MRQIVHQAGAATLWSTLATATAPLHGALSRTSYAHPVARHGTTPWLRRARDTIRLWQERSRGRQQLLRLDEHVLRDIGITRLQAEAEANKPFWRA